MKLSPAQLYALDSLACAESDDNLGNYNFAELANFRGWFRLRIGQSVKLERVTFSTMDSLASRDLVETHPQVNRAWRISRAGIDRLREQGYEITLQRAARQPDNEGGAS